MIIVDRDLKKLEESGKKIRVAMLGAGFMGRGIAYQIINVFPGMELVAVSNRNLDGAARAYREAGVDEYVAIGTAAELEAAIAAGKYAISEDPMPLCQAENVDVVLEVTGDVAFGAETMMEAIRNGKHALTFSAELDSTLGPVLKAYADKAGVVYSNCDGDQPGVTLNLYRFVVGIGMKPVLAGNIKGLQDPYRNPTTQEAFAKKWNQKAHMVTSFADGSKISFEQAIVANATGMQVAKRGMFGPTVERGVHVMDAVDQYPLEAMLEGPGIVDYIVGASPAPGVFIYATNDNPAMQHYLNLYKLGEGPLYTFYRPYHLCHFEVPNSVARAYLYGDPTIAPLGAPTVEVVATAKTDLKAGDTLDGIGYYMTYGECENADVVRAENLLLMGLAAGCKLKRDVPKDQTLSYDDVEVPEGQLVDQLRAEQNAMFG